MTTDLRLKGAPAASARIDPTPTLVELISDAKAWNVKITVGTTVYSTGSTAQADGTFRAAVTADLSGVAPGPITVKATFTENSKARTLTATARVIPGPSNTGPAVAEADLTPWSGGVIRTDTTLSGVLITAPVIVRGATLTLVDAIVRTGQMSGELVVDCRDGGHLNLDRVEVDGQGTARIGVGYAGVDVLRCDLHHLNDGVRLASGSTLVDSWVHDLVRYGTDHPDCAQATGGTGQRITGNRLDASTSADLGNAAVQLGAETNPLSDVVIQDNDLTGGNYTVNARTEVGAVSVLDNRFWGPVRYGPALVPAHVVVTGNVDGATGAPITVTRR